MERSRRLAELIERGVRDSEVREAKGLWMARVNGHYRANAVGLALVGHWSGPREAWRHYCGEIAESKTPLSAVGRVLDMPSALLSTVDDLHHAGHSAAWIVALLRDGALGERWQGWQDPQAFLAQCEREARMGRVPGRLAGLLRIFGFL